MVWKPRVTVAAVIEQDGRFLMVEEAIQGRLHLNQPAGHLEEGETLLAAVRREVLEETGHEFDARGLVGIYLWRNAGGGDTFLRLTFHGTAKSPATPQDLDPDIERALWLPADEIRRRQSDWRSPMVGRCLEDYLSGRRFPLAVINDLLAGA